MRSLRLGILILLMLSTSPHARAGGFLSRLFGNRSAELQQIRAGRFVFHTDAPLAGSALARELQQLDRQIRQELKLPADDRPVPIFVFSTRESYVRHVLKHVPELGRRETDRPALFVLRDGNPQVFVVAGPDLVVDLRHEYVHVVLNTAMENVPLWLDEGLAKYYESAGHPPMIGREHALTLLDRKLRTGWQPDLSRLERLTRMPQMRAGEYAEAWAWVNWIRQDLPGGDDLLCDYLTALRQQQPTPTINALLADQVLQPHSRMLRDLSTRIRQAQLAQRGYYPQR